MELSIMDQEKVTPFLVLGINLDAKGKHGGLISVADNGIRVGAGL